MPVLHIGCYYLLADSRMLIRELMWPVERIQLRSHEPPPAVLADANFFLHSRDVGCGFF